VAVLIAGCRLTTGLSTHQAGQYKMPPSFTETAELLDADFFTVKSIPELK
jgi:hypothetical protein